MSLLLVVCCFFLLLSMPLMIFSVLSFAFCTPLQIDSLSHGRYTSHRWNYTDVTECTDVYGYTGCCSDSSVALLFYRCIWGGEREKERGSKKTSNLQHKHTHAHSMRTLRCDANICVWNSLHWYFVCIESLYGVFTSAIVFHSLPQRYDATVQIHDK